MQSTKNPLKGALLSAALLFSLPTFSHIGEPVTSAALRAIGVTSSCVDCSAYKAELEELFGASNDLAIAKVLQALQDHPTAIDAAELRAAIEKSLTMVTDSQVRETAQKTLALCDTCSTRAMRTTEAVEYTPLPVQVEKLPTVTRAPADQWVVKKTTLGNTVTFDPATGNIMINQDLQVGAAVKFNSVTSNTGALGLDAVALSPVNIGNSTASAVNIATAGAATAVSVGTAASVTGITIGASGTTSTIGIAGVATTVTGSTSARVDAPTLQLGNTSATSITIGAGSGTTTLNISGATPAMTGTTSARVDAPTVNIGNTTATDVNVGSATATTTDLTGITTTVTGSTAASIDGTTVNLGNTTATTLNMGTTASTDINIGRAGTTTLDILGTTLNVTGTTTAVTGSTSARLDGLTVNIGNTTATDINIGSGSTATIDVVGTNLNITGTANMLAGNELRFWNPAGLLYNSIKAGAITGSNTATLILPLVNGSNGQVLTTDGAGVLSWSTPSTVNTNRVDAYRGTSNQTTAAATETVNFNTVTLGALASGVYTVPTTGIYAINAQVCVQPVDTGTKQIDLVKGGTAQTGYQSKIVVPILTNSGTGPTIYDTYMINFYSLVSLTAADLIRIDYTGTTGDILLQNATHFSAHLMST